MKRVALGALWVLLGSVAVRADEPVDYLRNVKPILQDRCYKCHGDGRRRAMLRLDTAKLILEGGESGPAITPSASAQSLIIKAVTGSEGWRMPPEDAGPALLPTQIDLLKRWIDQGAKAPDEPQPATPPKHWSYIAPILPRLPQTKDPAWSKNPIDRFIAARHEQLGLKPNSMANKEILLRRLYLDLIGLPPSPEQLAAFLSDQSPDAYERIVDELLTSPRYGERWGRHWMDIWRYSDWYGWGAEIRYSQRHLWRWRDWIIESLNSDKGYDRMVMEMLAGDELAPLDPDTVRATGFLARNWFKFNRNTWLENTVEHTAKAFLGATMNCARCHEHKYDPITQRDYYRFRAFFEPHDVRTWRVPGQSNLELDGLACVYDAKPEEPTYKFIRGNDKQPDKSRVMTPGLPKALSFGALKIEPVKLPLEAYYPGRREYIRRETLAAAEAELAGADQAVLAAKGALDAANRRLADFKAVKPGGVTPVAAADATQAAAAAANAAQAAAAAPATAAQPPAGFQEAIKDAQAAYQLADARRAAAQAQSVAVRAKIVADNATYATSPSPDAQSLKLIAAGAERQAAALQGAYTLAQLDHELAIAQAAAKPGDAKTQQAVTAAQAKVTEGRKALDTARAALANHDGNYTSLTPVYPSTSTGRRSALAKWIADRRNPLTARVAVNHIWLRHFGKPLVQTVFDFGANGVKPTHPQLLDYLAVRFMDEGWSMKSLHRLIVTSRAYRLSSGAGENEKANAAVDPDNRYLWRQNVRRAEAEVVRDSILAVSGRLELTMGGPELDQNLALTSYRRSVYYRTAPEKQSRFFMVFDAPSPTECYRRDESVVPQQALAMVNSTLTLEQARTVAAVLTWEVGAAPTAANDEEFIHAAYMRVLGRAPRDHERDECRKFLDDQAGLLAQPQELRGFSSESKANVKPADKPHLRARENLVQVLMNHNDFITIR